jgi:phage protein U
MSAVYAVLGDIQFQLVAYWSGYQTEQAAEYVEHPLVGRKPRLQFVGLKLDTVKIDIKLHYLVCDPEAELAKMRAALASRSALRLVMGDGRYEGMFVVESLTVTQIKTNHHGRHLVFDAVMGLKESPAYNPLQAKRAAAIDQAAQNIKAAPKWQIPPGATSPASAIPPIDGPRGEWKGTPGQSYPIG